MSDKFEMYCIVELFGHQQIAGMVSEQEIAGTAFLRVDVPEIEGISGFTKFYGGSAVYGITPVDEATCLAAVRGFRKRPIETYRLELPQLQEKVEVGNDYDDFDDDFDEYE